VSASDELAARPHPDLLEHSLNVVLDRLHLDHQILGEFAIGQPARQQQRDFVFAPGQSNGGRQCGGALGLDPLAVVVGRGRAVLDDSRDAIRADVVSGGARSRDAIHSRSPRGGLSEATTRVRTTWVANTDAPSPPPWTGAGVSEGEIVSVVVVVVVIIAPCYNWFYF
jgi:hypothetical protein